MPPKKKKLYLVLKPVTHRITGETVLPGGEIDLSHVEDPADLQWMFDRGLIQQPEPVQEDIPGEATDREV